MAKMRIPPSPAIRTQKITEFLGADYSESSDISFSRSPKVVNMIRDTPGKVRKRLGFKLIKSFKDRINGVHYLADGTEIIHAGENLYIDNTEVPAYGNLNDDYSTSVQLAGKMIIFDGKRAIVVQTTGENTHTFTPLDSGIGTIPTTFIARAPTGGGTPLQPINMVQPKRTVRFLSTTTDKVYQFPYYPLDAATVEVKIKNSSGGFDTYTEGTEFTVDRTLGKITFSNVPPAPVVSGEDNVFITASKTNEEYKANINKALVCTLYGSNGGRDRIFCARDNNKDFYCEFNDPLFWGDLSYTNLGSDSSKIMGYSIVSDKLVTHLDYADDDTTAILRESFVIENKTQFRLAGSYQGNGAISKHAFGVLATEPMYPTVDGISAVTPADYTTERSAQIRSYYINRTLKKQDLSTSYGCIYNDFYMLAVGQYIFALDSLQVSTTRDMPYSTRQYEGYMMDKINARILWEHNGILYFGTENGSVDEFFTDYNLLSSYNEEGRKI